MSDQAKVEETAKETKPAAPAEAPKTNAMAIVSLVTSFFFQLIGLITGIVALSQIKKSGEGGKGLAVAGIIISAIGIIFGLLFFFLFFLGIIAAGNIEDTIPEPSPITEQQQESNTPAVQIGEETTIDDLKVKVLSVGKPDLGEYQKPKSGNEYINVELEVTNDGYETEYISPTQVYLKDGDNNKYSYSIFAVETSTPSISGELASNDTVRGIVGFELPKDASGVKLYFQGTSYNGAAAVVELD